MNIVLYNIIKIYIHIYTIATVILIVETIQLQHIYYGLFYYIKYIN